jgi:hypothetical protein
MNESTNEFPASGNSGKAIRAGLNAVSGLIPLGGGLLAAIAGAWSEREQEKINSFLQHWFQMLQDELKEKEKTIIEITQRLDMHDQKISERIKSPEFQALLKKCFRNWSAVENEKKRELVRNILANAAASNLSTDDVIKLFIDWINQYSEFHFQVISCIYQHPNGISRGNIWDKIGKKEMREDSADADLYKLLIRDLSTGGIIRQYRQTDYHGNFVKQPQRTKKNSGTRTNQMTSAFDKIELYVLTSLGSTFVHYAMTDIPIKIEFQPNLN